METIKSIMLVFSVAVGCSTGTSQSENPRGYGENSGAIEKNQQDSNKNKKSKNSPNTSSSGKNNAKKNQPVATDQGTGGVPSDGQRLLKKVTYADIKPILDRSCVAGCHGPGGSRPSDFSTYPKAVNYKSSIIRTSVGTSPSMPPKGRTPLTPEEKKLIEKWEKDGFLQSRTSAPFGSDLWNLSLLQKGRMSETCLEKVRDNRRWDSCLKFDVGGQSRQVLGV